MLGRTTIKRPSSGARTADGEAVEPETSSVKPLPLEAVVEAHGGGWSVRLPVRAELVSVEKASILREEVRVLRAVRQDTETVQASMRSEQLKVEDDVTRP